MQINNEPNIEWPANCTGCKWTVNGQTRTYSWSGIYDFRLYQAINDFYTDAWWTIDWYKNNHSDPTIRGRLQQMEIWSPPMSDIYRDLNTTPPTNLYGYLHGMFSTYGRMTYHAYPSPNYDGDGAGGLDNNSWNKGFDSWVRTNIGNSSLRSMITEFGWNPIQITSFYDGHAMCNKYQHQSWPANDAKCPTSDGYTHNFQADVNRFLTYHRHGAEVVAVWIERGWNDQFDQQDRVNGIDPTGNVRTWLHDYQWSSP